MAYSCDICGKDASIDHKISCERCYNLLLHMLTAFKGAKTENRAYKKRKVKRKKKKIVSPNEVKTEKKEGKPEKTERELLFEKATSKKADAAVLLTKCATCEFGFMDGEAKKISCTEGKDPKVCGK